MARLLTVWFDIDGTLLTSQGAGGQAIRDTFQSKFGKAVSLMGVVTAGRPDRAVFKEVCETYQLPWNAEIWSEMSSIYAEHLATAAVERPFLALAGAAKCLQTIQQLPRTSLALLTGNIRAGAEIKLRSAGLSVPFTQGVFGDLYEDRIELAARAITLAKSHGECHHRNPQHCVIGDTPADIACARWMQAVAVVVATGRFSGKELASHQPDLLLASLEQLEPLLELLQSDRDQPFAGKNSAVASGMRGTNP